MTPAKWRGADNAYEIDFSADRSPIEVHETTNNGRGSPPGLFNADTLDGWAPVWGWNKLIPSAAVV
jgi:hypothetical protein